MFILRESNKRGGNPRRQTPTSLPLITFDIVLFLNAFPLQAGRGGREGGRARGQEETVLERGKYTNFPTDICGLGWLSQDLRVAVALRMGVGVPPIAQAVNLG